MIVALKELGDIYTGNTPSKKINDYYDSNDIYFVKPDIISDSEISIISNSNEYISEKAREKARIVPKDSIFVTCIGTIGKVGIASDGEFAFNQQINTIKPNDSIVPKYLAYNLFHSKARLNAISNAPVVPIINKSQFSEFTIKIETDKSKQKEIVSTLDLLQSIITHRRTQLEKLDLLVKSRFVEMFGDPVHNTFQLSTMPMTNICEIIDGDRGKNYPKQEEFFSKEYCLFLNAKNVTKYGFNFSECLFITKEKDAILRKGKLQRGDVVLTTRGTLGNLAFYTKEIPFENIRINSGMVILRMNRKVINETFFIEQFRMQVDDIKQSIASGSAQPQLPISTMNKINIITPELEFQTQFADFVKQVDKSKVAIQKELEKSQMLFDSLMQEYFG